MIIVKKALPACAPAKSRMLIKSVYGWETDPKKTPFGLINDQIRVDNLVKSAGWFNYQGEKLGKGDLSLIDLHTILAVIPKDEMFLAVPESDAVWDMPKHLDRSSPGTAYILHTATWMVSRDTGIVRVRDFGVGEVAVSGNIRYRKVPRTALLSAFGKTEVKKATVKF